MKTFVITTLLFANLLGYPAEAVNKQNTPANAQSCNVYAFVTDKDPNGLNVRSQPNSNARVLAKLPTRNVDEVAVKITTSQGKWVQISEAESPQKVVFQGKGWVDSSLLGTTTRGYETKSVRVYQSANSQSKALGNIPSKTAVQLVGCQGRWVKIKHLKLSGWLAPNDQCATGLTTCS